MGLAAFLWNLGRVSEICKGVWGCCRVPDPPLPNSSPQESYVWKMYQERCWDFFPAGDCFRKQYEDQLG